MARTTVVAEAGEIHLAAELIRLGARLPTVAAETSLGRERLTRLYVELTGQRPPKGSMPYAIDWYLPWLPNIHTSLFHSFYRRLIEIDPEAGVRAAIDAYYLYLENINAETEPLLSFTRAWSAVGLIESGLLGLTSCFKCETLYLVNPARRKKQSGVCAMCHPPRLAKQTRAQQSLALPNSQDVFDEELVSC